MLPSFPKQTTAYHTQQYRINETDYLWKENLAGLGEDIIRSPRVLLDDGVVAFHIFSVLPYPTFPQDFLADGNWHNFPLQRGYPLVIEIGMILHA